MFVPHFVIFAAFAWALSNFPRTIIKSFDAQKNMSDCVHFAAFWSHLKPLKMH